VKKHEKIGKNLLENGNEDGTIERRNNGFGGFPLGTGMRFAAGSTVYLDWSSAVVGQVVAQGTRVQQNGTTGCNFPDTINVTTTAVPGHNRSLDLIVVQLSGNNCQLVVNSKQDNVSGTGPGDCALCCNCYGKTLFLDWWMYGYGGKWDRLTAVTNTLGVAVDPGVYVQVTSTNA
jgi:hypothetical protein